MHTTQINGYIAKALIDLFIIITINLYIFYDPNH